MRKEAFGRKLCVCLTLVLGLGGAALADHHEEQAGEMSPEAQAMMEAWMKAGTPGEEHQTLADHAGTWKATVTTWMEPGEEPMMSEGTFHREMILDGRVMQERYEGEFMGQGFEGMSLTGYDNAKGEYWTTWVDSMSTTIMTAWGKWDEEMQAVVYEGSSTDPMTGEPHHVKTVVRFPEEGKEVMEMYEMRGGEEVKAMEIVSVKE